MADNETRGSGDLAFKPCARAFFVYYVAMALAFLGPRLNPEMGVPVWLGTLLGFMVVAVVVYRKYGQEYVAQIITFGKMQARAVIRDVGRALNMPYGEVDRIAKMIPNTLNITLEEALQQEPRLNELARGNPEVKKLITLARSLEGLPRHASTDCN